MNNREIDHSNNIDKTNFVSRIARVGGAVVDIIESPMSQPIPGEPSEGFKQLIGTGVLAASAVGVVGAMHVIDHYTGVGVNPLNYVWALHQLTTY